MVTLLAIILSLALYAVISIPSYFAIQAAIAQDFWHFCIHALLAIFLRTFIVALAAAIAEN